jgi:hypothetical protein
VLDDMARDKKREEEARIANISAISASLQKSNAFLYTTERREGRLCIQSVHGVRENN